MESVELPLTEAVEFKTILQKGNRVQLPRLIRWKFKLETDQILKVIVFPAKSLRRRMLLRADG